MMVYISVAAVTATGGFARTASPFSTCPPKIPCGSWLASDGGPDSVFIQAARIIVGDHRWQASSHRVMRTIKEIGR